MAAAAKLTRTFSRQFSSGAARVWRQLSLEPQRTPRRAGAAAAAGAVAGPTRFGLARQSSLDPTPAAESASPLAMPDNLDATMRLLYAACQGDAAGVEELLREEGVDVDSIDFDGRTALHIAACEGRGEVVRLLLGWKANINARDRWGSTVRTHAHTHAKLFLSTRYAVLGLSFATTPYLRAFGRAPLFISFPQLLSHHYYYDYSLQGRPHWPNLTRSNCSDP
jgi:hypothetical protein